MDIKTLLLKSLSSKKPIKACRRIYVGKLCFIIKYMIKGKILTIRRIKAPNCKIKTWAERIKHYRSNYKRYRKKKNKMEEILKSATDKATLTEEIPKFTKIIQTEISEMPPITKTKSTQSEMLAITSSAQQTIASIVINRKPLKQNPITSLLTCSTCCQTDLVSYECRGVQCKRLSHAKSTNTDDNTRNSSTQSDLFIIKNPEISCEPLGWNAPGRDFDVVIYMLNEIGEIVINQNQLLNSNSKMIKEIAESNLVSDSKTLENDSRSISTQTDELVKCAKSDNSSQTTTNFIKSRKLLCLKGKSSQHKKPADMRKA